ncbi:hypothetical protein JZ751_022172 [Albula glossodonta]|uniref:FH2 domain-containing protein n=1 Tax=Albula glossodonta TaxID=121402 RepID=A0A8T2MXI1_9TELE|nr:hypothetical protein JZ751_022172 [Albula glossodonta]
MYIWSRTSAEFCLFFWRRGGRGLTVRAGPAGVALVSEPEPESDVQPATSPEPEATEPEPSTEPEEDQSPEETVAADQEQEVAQVKPEQEAEEGDRTAVKEEEVRKEEEERLVEAEPVAEAEPEPEVVVEQEQEQAPERESEDNVVLSEKERQNEEVNEKDNCSASSISSASSTLEREEREEKLTSDNETGQWAQCIKDVDVNEQCSKILNNKLFMLDMLYAQNKKPPENEEEEGVKDKEEKGLEEQDPSVASLAARISTLEANRQACEENVKKMDVGHLDNQGSVRAFAEKFGDLVKGLVSPPEIEAQEKQQQPEKAAPSPLPPKKESDYIWDQLMASPRELRIKDMDFTDLAEEDDLDILDMGTMMGPGDPVPPPPPPPCISALPPPPPLFGCPPPPPVPGMMMPPPPPFVAPAPPTPAHLGSPQLSRGEPPLFQKKKKTIRLFWNEVRPVDWQYRNHKRCQESLWSKLEPIKVDTSKLEHLFETKSKELPVTKAEVVCSPPIAVEGHSVTFITMTGDCISGFPAVRSAEVTHVRPFNPPQELGRHVFTPKLHTDHPHTCSPCYEECGV